jgi:hypothetical protein
VEFAFLLAIPLGGAILLGICGARRFAPDLNAFLSAGTLVAACALTARSMCFSSR